MMLAPTHAPLSPSLAPWPASPSTLDKENAAASSSSLARRKSRAFLASTPYDRPAHAPSSAAAAATASGKRRIHSVTNIVGPSSSSSSARRPQKGLRVPSLAAVACKIESQAPLVEGHEASPTLDPHQLQQQQHVPRSPAGAAVTYDRAGGAFLPLSLPRPDRMAVIDVVAVEALEGVPYPYVMDRLMEQGPLLLQHALAARLAQPTPGSSGAQKLVPPLPPALEFDLRLPALAPAPAAASSVGATAALAPNYVLAVRPPPTGAGQQQGTLLPIHDLVYRATCAHLPPIPPRSPSLPATSLPVVSITLPSPSTLPVLNTFLYTQRPDVLLSSLLALPPFPAGAPRTRAQLTAHLAARMDLRQLFERVGVVHQVWGNVCALGVADALLWKALDTAWEVLVGSVALVQSRAAGCPASVPHAHAHPPHTGPTHRPAHPSTATAAARARTLVPPTPTLPTRAPSPAL